MGEGIKWTPDLLNEPYGKKEGVLAVFKARILFGSTIEQLGKLLFYHLLNWNVEQEVPLGSS